MPDQIYDLIMSVDDLALLRSLALHVAQVEQMANLHEIERAPSWEVEDTVLGKIADYAMLALTVVTDMTSLIETSLQSDSKHCVVTASADIRDFLVHVAHHQVGAATSPGILRAAATVDGAMPIEEYAKKLARVQLVVDGARPRVSAALVATERQPSAGSFTVSGPQGEQ